MLAVNRGLKRSIYHVLMLLAAGALVASPAMAQINTVDPNDVIDSDLGTPPPAATVKRRAAAEKNPGIPKCAYFASTTPSRWPAIVHNIGVYT